MRRADGMVAARHQNHRPVFGGHDFVKLAAVVIDPVKNIALRRVHPVIISLLEVGFLGKIVGIMLVRRVGRPVARRRDHLHNKKAVRRLGFGKNVADMARIGAGSPRLERHAVRTDQPGWQGAIDPRGAADRKLHIGAGIDTPCRFHRHIDSVRRDLVKDTCPPFQHAGVERAGGNSRIPRQQDKTDLVIRAVNVQPVTGGQVVQSEPDIGPSCRARRDIMNSPVAKVRSDQKFRHNALSLKLS